MKGRYLGHRDTVRTIFFFCERRSFSVEGLRSHTIFKTRQRQRLDVVLDELNRDVALEVEANVVRELVSAHLFPAILDDCSGLNSRHCKRLSFYLSAVYLFNSAF